MKDDIMMLPRHGQTLESETLLTVSEWKRRSFVFCREAAGSQQTTERGEKGKTPLPEDVVSRRRISMK